VTRRAQLVLVAAAVVAVALAPAVLAYLQLGYHADVAASGDTGTTTTTAVRFLERAVHEAGTAVSGDHAWRARAGAVRETKRHLRPRLDRLRTARVADGVVVDTAYNATAARGWVAGNCPRGPDRQFGPCAGRDGVALQSRGGRTHVLAVAFDVTVTAESGRTDATLVVRTVTR